MKQPCHYFRPAPSRSRLSHTFRAATVREPSWALWPSQKDEDAVGRFRRINDLDRVFNGAVELVVS